MKNEIIKNALVNALLTALYVAIVASFLFYAPKFLGERAKANTPVIPMAMLMLFVFSAALTGALLLGRPVLWYLDGKKKEAVALFGYTLGIFLVITICALLMLYFVA